MCEPTTMAAIAPYLMAAGTVVTAYGASEQAQSQKDLARYNSQVATNNATLAEYEALDATKRGDEEAAAIRRNSDMLKGSQRASMAAKGLDLAEGTAAELQDQTEFFALTDMATAKNNAARQAWGNRTQGLNYRNESGKQTSISNSINPLMAAGTTLLTGAGQVANKWYTQPKSQG